jgi:hypothetical protein
MSHQNFSNSQESIVDQQIKSTEVLSPSVSEIIAHGDPVELQELDNKYSVVQSSEGDKIETIKTNELVVITSEVFSKNFPGSTVIKNDEGKYFAVRKNKDSEWEGNSFTLMSDGNIGAVYQEHSIDEGVIEAVEKKIEFTVPILDRKLIDNDANEDKRAMLINKLKNIPASEIIKVYHGLKSDLRSALSILESQEPGVKQISGPCLSLSPSGAYWPPGSTGFEYSLLRGDIEFPGENNKGAHFRLDDMGTIHMINGLDYLPLNKYDGKILRTEGTKEVYEKDEDGFNRAKLINGVWKDLPPVQKEILLTEEETEIEKQIQEKIKAFSDARVMKNN